MIEYVGELVSNAEATRRADLCPEAGMYHLEIPSSNDRSVVIDAYAVRNLAAFINFSCEPNLEMRPIASACGDSRVKRVGFFAKCDINADDELCYRRDSNAYSSRARQKEVECHCGAANCMGYV